MKCFNCVIGLLILLIPFTISATAETKKPPPPQTIAKYEEDVTGDSQKETILLEGILFSQDTNYYMNIWATVIAKDGKEWKISYEGGYEPHLQFVDLNHDQINDIYYLSATGGSGGLYNYHLNTLAKEQLKKIPLPEQHYVKAEFKNNFKVEIQISPESDPYIVDVRDRAADYIRLGIYNKEGKLLGKTSPMVDPIAFYEPVLVSKSKGFGLKSYQQISGAYHADQLGTVETLWYYEKGKWIILQTKWVTSE